MYDHKTTMRKLIRKGKVIFEALDGLATLRIVFLDVVHALHG